MGRSPCCSKEGLNRGTWTAKEDVILSDYIRIHGDGEWKNLPQKAGLKRCGKSCRLHWINYIRPGIKRGEISIDEEEIIIRMHRLLGNRWSLIAGRLPGRTDNEIKNYWNTHLKKKRPPIQESQGKTILKSPSPLQSNVITSTPVRLTTAEKRSEMVSANGCNGSGNRNCIYSDQSFKLFTTEGIVNSSKSWCNLPAKDPIAEDHPERIAVANLGDVHMVETEITNFTLAVQQSPPCDQFTGHSATIAQRLCDLNVLSSPVCNLLSSASFCSTDFGSEEFHTGAESKDCEGMCSDQSNIQYIDSSTFADDQGRVEISDTVHHVDWIHEFDYIWN